MTKPVVGRPFVVPVGVPVHWMKSGSWEPSRRQQTIYPDFVETYWQDGIDLGTAVTWSGGGGYWKRVRVLGDGTFVQGWPGLVLG